MKEGTNKFLVSVFILLMSFFVVVAPFLSIEKVNAQEEGDFWTTLAPLPMRQSMYLVDAVYTGTAALNGKIYYIDLNMTLRYDPETKTIFINLDHPQVSSAYEAGGKQTTTRQFREMWIY